MSDDHDQVIVKNDIKVEQVSNGNVAQYEGPPDRGARAYCIAVASFFCNGLIFGVMNSYGVIYRKLQEQLESQEVEDASTKAALVGSLSIGMTFCMSPIASILVDKIGLQRTTFIGGCIAVLGMLASSFLTETVEMLYLTYGVLFGAGASLAYTPSLVILGHYFKKYLGLVNGFVTAGSSCFTIAMPFALEYLLNSYGLDVCLQCLAGLMSILVACAFIFKPLPLPPTPDSRRRHNHTLRAKLRSVINVDIWKKKRYVIWALAIPSALFGYFVPYVHINKFVEQTFKENDGKVLVLCIGVTSGLGRLIFGKISDLPKVDRILLQQISFVTIGILTMLVVAANHFTILIFLALGMGLADGCFISLLGPIAFDLCGQSGGSQAIGFLLGLLSIPLTIGPPIAGYIFDQTGSYTLPFILAGIPPIVGAGFMFLIRIVPAEKTDVEIEATEPLNTNELKSEVQNGVDKKALPVHLSNGDTRPPPPSYKEAVKDKQENGAVRHSNGTAITSENEKAVIINHTEPRA